MVLVFWIISGIIAGWLAGLVTHRSSYGVAGDFMFGLIGGLVGGFLGNVTGLQPATIFEQILIAAAGGAVLVWILHLVHPGPVGA